MPFDRERGIAAQSAGAQAAVIVAALIRAGQNVETHAVFQAWRTMIFEGTLAMAEVPAVGNPQYPYPPPENVGNPQQVVAQVAVPPVPQAPVTTAQGVTPNCKHGVRVFKTGTSSKGPWSAWFCSEPKDSRDKCDPIFL